MIRDSTSRRAVGSLGVAPLLQDIFWVAMSVTIMAGLTFGTVLTMVAVPLFYTVLYRVHPRPQ